MAKPPNFIGTSASYGAPYVNHLVSVPPIILSAPSATAENSLHKLAAIHIPAPLQPTKMAAKHASQTAIDRLKELFAKVRL